VSKTPHFYEGASKRLNSDLGGAHKYAQEYFGGQHLYLEELKKNIEFARATQLEEFASGLKRIPPKTIPD
jgi:hypothetical protein